MAIPNNEIALKLTTGMANENFFWIYLIFFIIPLARIIPRLVRKWQNQNNEKITYDYKQRIQNSEQYTEAQVEPIERPASHQTEDMQVLGEINRGVKNFNQIQKNTNIDNQKLENILKNLEDKGLMKVVKKEGIFGVKIELAPTEKGFKKFYT